MAGSPLPNPGGGLVGCEMEDGSAGWPEAGAQRPRPRPTPATDTHQLMGCMHEHR